MLRDNLSGAPKIFCGAHQCYSLEKLTWSPAGDRELLLSCATCLKISSIALLFHLLVRAVPVFLGFSPETQQK